MLRTRVLKKGAEEGGQFMLRTKVLSKREKFMLRTMVL